jgi:Uma2 family endonuclease
MATLNTPTPTLITAASIPAEDYMARYAGDHFEWVRGAVVKMTPVSLQHTLIVDYLRDLLRTYFVLNPMGRVLGEPFVMRLDTLDVYREPDLQVILSTNPGQLTDTAMIGPADLCIEVVSPESVTRDYGEKFEEYEKAGVREYWIIDPVRQISRFHRLQATGLYAEFYPDTTGNYQTPLLPRLSVYVSTLWQDKLPDVLAVVESVREMLASQSES